MVIMKVQPRFWEEYGSALSDLYRRCPVSHISIPGTRSGRCCFLVNHGGGKGMKERKLCKSKENRLVCGVCAGLARYFGVDATLVRLIFAALTVIGGSGIWLYLIAALIMPDES